jgi:hypothetical protein
MPSARSRCRLAAAGVSALFEPVRHAKRGRGLRCLRERRSHSPVPARRQALPSLAGHGACLCAPGLSGAGAEMNGWSGRLHGKEGRGREGTARAPAASAPATSAVLGYCARIGGGMVASPPPRYRESLAAHCIAASHGRTPAVRPAHWIDQPRHATAPAWVTRTHRFPSEDGTARVSGE